MAKFLIIILTIINILYFSKNDFILPFKTVILSNNASLTKEDFLSNILSRRLCSEFLIGSNWQNIKLIINMSQIGFYIYDNAYEYNSSSTFKMSTKIKSFYHKNHERGYDANDTICLIEYTPNLNLNNLNIKKCKNFRSVNFELLKSDEIPNEISYYSKYGIIGLGMHSSQDIYSLSTFIKALKNTDMIDSHYFSFNFSENQNNGNINGYLYIGEEKFDEDKGIKNKVISFPIYGQMFWNLKFQKIYTAKYNKTNSSIYENYREFDVKTAELIADLSYIIAVKQYRIYITEIFFREFMMKDICTLTNVKLDEDYSTFVCDNKSELFRKKLENEFPILQFQHYDLNKTFVFDQNDLFTYNYLNKSDTNIYFLILFSAKQGSYNPENPSKNEIIRWKLGIPFFKKYKLIFNADSREISYYEKIKSESNPEEKESEEKESSDNNDTYTDHKDKDNENNSSDKKSEENPNKKLYLILGIGGGGSLLIIFFVFGFLCHKNIIKLPRKKKANELDDDYEYSINSTETFDKKAPLHEPDISS